MSKIIKLFDRIKEATTEELKKKTIWEIFASAAEELGEVSQELSIEEESWGNGNKKVKEGSQVESVDLVICAMSLFFARGGTIEKLVDIGNKKMDKWVYSQQVAIASAMLEKVQNEKRDTEKEKR
jgi:hypothetical protein